MTIKQLEHIDEFSGDYIVWIDIDGESLPSSMQEKAKELDEENYLSECFGACVNIVDGKAYVCYDSDCPLYYVLNNGNKVWMKYSLSEEEETSLIAFAQQEIRKIA